MVISSNFSGEKERKTKNFILNILSIKQSSPFPSKYEKMKSLIFPGKKILATYKNLNQNSKY